MTLKIKTILITGGSSGMGLELAKQVLERDRHNTVITSL
jgi:short-subunit dehydrogenase involved in D-alanine esterification of teichoic acids